MRQQATAIAAPIVKKDESYDADMEYKTPRDENSCEI